MSSAPERKEAATPAEAGASKKPLLIVGLAALLAGAGIGAVVLPGLLPGGKAAPDGERTADAASENQGAGTEAAAGGAEHASKDGKEPEGEFADRIVQFEPFVVNVSGESYPRYLKLQVVFEMSDAAAKAKLEERVAQVRDLTISMLSSKRLADITDFEGKALLKDDLRAQVEELLGRDTVVSVMFTEFVVQ
jgi:flagellar basal body-associated protein FliL